jgi:hypothetical protein
MPLSWKQFWIFIITKGLLEHWCSARKPLPATFVVLAHPVMRALSAFWPFLCRAMKQNLS